MGEGWKKPLLCVCVVVVGEGEVCKKDGLETCDTVAVGILCCCHCHYCVH